MKVIVGNIFTSKCKTIVNTVNCVGVMGAGIALEFRLRYPDMYKKYKKLCEENKIDIGVLWIYKSPGKWILNFPTKKHWRFPSTVEYLEKGLKIFVKSYKEKNLESVAFPILGASKGGIDPEISLTIMGKYLSACDIPIEVYKFDHLAYDDLIVKLYSKLTQISDKEFSRTSGIRQDLASKIYKEVVNNRVRTISNLLKYDGIGINTVEKLYIFIQSPLFLHKTFDFDN